MKKWIIALPLMVLMLTSFTNCSPYSQSDTAAMDSLSSLSCPNTSNKCVTATPDNLNILVNLMNNSNQMLLTAASDFNIAGDCNEGGYTSNLIRWELYDGQTKLRDSQTLGYNATCINGRFLMYVNLASVTSDPVNRTMGVNAAGGRSQYQLRYTIWGVSSSGYVVGVNSAKSILLQPLTL